MTTKGGIGGNTTTLIYLHYPDAGLFLFSGGRGGGVFLDGCFLSLQVVMSCGCGYLPRYFVCDSSVRLGGHVYLSVFRLCVVCVLIYDGIWDG